MSKLKEYIVKYSYENEDGDMIIDYASFKAEDCEHAKEQLSIELDTFDFSLLEYLSCKVNEG